MKLTAEVQQLGRYIPTWSRGMDDLVVFSVRSGARIQPGNRMNRPSGFDWMNLNKLPSEFAYHSAPVDSEGARCKDLTGFSSTEKW